MIGRQGKGILALAMCLACVAYAAPAQASYHLNKIREISGSMAGTDSAYVELQMYASGENLVSGHNITIWNSSGVIAGMVQPIDTIPLTGPNPPNSQNQRTILIGDTGVPGADFTVPQLSTYLQTGAPGNILPAGAVCYEGIPVDCVSWGGTAMGGSGNLPDKATPFGQPLPTTFAIKRKITAGCATLLEAGDDTNKNENDFVPSVPRDPTPNSAAPIEKDCKSGGLTPPPGSNFKCKGKAATLIGTAGKNTIKGTSKRDVIVGFGGNDTVKGRGGNDVLCGNGGKDKLIGGAGKDLLVGGAGADKLIGGAGKDTLSGQGGKDTCNGGPGRNTETSCSRAAASTPSQGTVY